MKAALASRIGQAGIVAAAAKVFARLGFEATRVEDILEESGVSRRTFYAYFSSKDGVLAAVYDLATAELLRSMRDIPASEPLLAVRHGLDTFLDYHVENAALLRVLVERAVQSGSPLAPARKRLRTDLIAFLGTAVQAATGKKHDPMLYAALLSALEGTSLELFEDGVSPERVARAKDVMHLLVVRVLGP